MNTKKKKLYGSIVNLSGLYSDKPILLHHNKDFVRENKYAREKGWLDDVIEEWWDKSGDVGFDGPGLTVKENIVRFAGTKREVECFIMGVQACCTLLKRWAWSALKVTKSDE